LRSYLSNVRATLLFNPDRETICSDPQPSVSAFSPYPPHNPTRWHRLNKKTGTTVREAKRNETRRIGVEEGKIKVRRARNECGVRGWEDWGNVHDNFPIPTAPFAAFTMACLLFVYTRPNITATKRNTRKPWERDGE
jgi:hypothetical protein